MAATNGVNRVRFLLCGLAVLGGCATVAPPWPTPTDAPSVVAVPPTPGTEAIPPPPPDTPPAVVQESPVEPAPATSVRRENIAVASLIERANTDAKAGRLANAAASIERALRIEPRNPRLWHELARIRVQQGDYLQAESTAARANAWAQGDAALRSANWRLIAEARQARGDRTGARAALDTADRQR
jgi:tetratricopeptide (TPR) repeat protein